MPSRTPTLTPGPSSVQPLDLLGFPAEISQRILGHILDQLPVTPDLAVDLGGSQKPRYDRFRLPKEIAAAYLVCKQLRADIDAVFFEYLTLRIPSSHVVFGVDFNSRFNDQGRSLSRIRHLSISPELLQVLTWEWIVQHLTYLEVLAIEPYRVLGETIGTGRYPPNVKLLDYVCKFFTSQGVDIRILVLGALTHRIFQKYLWGMGLVDQLAWEYLSREAYFNLGIQLHLLFGTSSFLSNDARDMWNNEPQASILSIPALQKPAHLRAVLEASPHTNRNMRVHLNFGAVQRIDNDTGPSVSYGRVWVSGTGSFTYSPDLVKYLSTNALGSLVREIQSCHRTLRTLGLQQRYHEQTRTSNRTTDQQSLSTRVHRQRHPTTIAVKATSQKHNSKHQPQDPQSGSSEARHRHV